MLIILNKTSDKIFCKAFKQSDHPVVNLAETIFVGQHEIRFLNERTIDNLIATR